MEYSAPIRLHVRAVDTQRITNFYVTVERRPHILIDVGIDYTAIDRHSLDVAARDERTSVFLAYRFLRLAAQCGFIVRRVPPEADTLRNQAGITFCTPLGKPR